MLSADGAWRWSPPGRVRLHWDGACRAELLREAKRATRLRGHDWRLSLDGKTKLHDDEALECGCGIHLISQERLKLRVRSLPADAEFHLLVEARFGKDAAAGWVDALWQARAGEGDAAVLQDLFLDAPELLERGRELLRTCMGPSPSPEVVTLEVERGTPVRSIVQLSWTPLPGVLAKAAVERLVLVLEEPCDDSGGGGGGGERRSLRRQVMHGELTALAADATLALELPVMAPLVVRVSHPIASASGAASASSSAHADGDEPLECMLTLEKPSADALLGVRITGDGHPMVVSVARGAIADAAGLRANDVITSVNGVPTHGHFACTQMLRSSVGVVTIGYQRREAVPCHSYSASTSSSRPATAAAPRYGVLEPLSPSRQHGKSPARRNTKMHDTFKDLFGSDSDSDGSGSDEKPSTVVPPPRPAVASASATFATTTVRVRVAHRYGWPAPRAVLSVAAAREAIEESLGMRVLSQLTALGHPLRDHDCLADALAALLPQQRQQELRGTGAVTVPIELMLPGAAQAACLAGDGASNGGDVGGNGGGGSEWDDRRDVLALATEVLRRCPAGDLRSATIRNRVRREVGRLRRREIDVAQFCQLVTEVTGTDEVVVAAMRRTTTSRLARQSWDIPSDYSPSGPDELFSDGIAVGAPCTTFTPRYSPASPRYSPTSPPYSPSSP